MSTEDLAISRLSFGLAQPSQGEAEDRARIQQGIDAAMRGVITDRYHPSRREPAPTVTVAGAVPVKDRFPPEPVPVRRGGWAPERPLTSPMPNGSFVEGVVGAMIDHVLGPAVRKLETEGGPGVPKQSGGGG